MEQITYNPILQVHGWIDAGGFWHPVPEPETDQPPALDIWDT